MLVGKFESARQKTQALAAVTPPQPGSPVHNPNTAAVNAEADPAGTIRAIAALSAVPVARTGEPGKAFHSLFQTEGGRGPISPVVGALWGGAKAEVAPPTPLPPPSLRSVLRPAAQRAEAGDLRDLYQNGRRNARGLFNGSS